MNTPYRNYVRFLRYFAPYWLILIFVLFLLVIVTSIKFTIPLVMMYLIDQFGKAENNGRFLVVLIGISGVIIAAYFLRLLLLYLLNVIKEKIFFKAQLKLFIHIHKLPIGFFHDHPPGYLISRIRNDIYAAQGLLADRFVSLIMSVMTLIVGVMLCLWINVEMTLVTLLLLPAFAVAAILPNRKLRGLSGSVQEKNALVLDRLQESLSGILPTKLFDRERWQRGRLAQRLTDEIRAKIRLVVFGNSVGQLAEVITNLSILLALGYGALKVSSHAITIGQLVAFVSFYGYLFSSVGNLISLNVEVQGALGAIERVYALLDMAPEPTSVGGSPLPDRREGPGDRLVFENVCFAYRDREAVLRDVSFDVARGEIVAVVGRTGSGKSTLAALVPRLYDPQRGSIRLAGTDLRDIPLQALRHRVVLLTHTPFLFAATVRDNMTMGRREVRDSDIEAAAFLADLDRFIADLPDGYRTVLGPKGTQLSLGQSQRLALVRALLQGPDVLIFDEALSGIDAQCERTIMDRLVPTFRTRLVINISHRLFSVQNASKIILLEEGQIIDAGNHEDLITTSPLYRDLCKRQLIASDNSILSAH